MASIGIGFLGEPAIATLIEPRSAAWSARRRDGDLGRDRLHVRHRRSTSRSASRCRRCSRSPGPSRRRGSLSRPLDWFRIADAPFTLALNKVSNAILRLFGVNPDELEEKHTPRTCKAIIRDSARAASLDPGEAGMLGGVFHLHEQEAREVMTPIPAVVTVDADETVEDALRRCVSSGHTRLVVIEDDNPDRVRGIVHNNSLVRLYMNAGRRRLDRAGDPRRPDLPETKPLDDLLAELQRQRSSIARRRRRVRPHGRDRHRRGHPRGGRRRDRGRDRPARRLGPPPRRRRLVRARPRLARRPRGRRDRAAGRHRRLQLDRRLRLQRARPAAASAATRSAPTATRSGSSRCARTGSSRCGSTRRRPSTRRASAPAPRALAASADPRRAASVRAPSSVAAQSSSATKGSHVGRRLTDKQLEVLRAVLRSEEHLGPALAARSRRSSSRAGTTCPTRAALGARSPTRPAARASPRPTSSGTSRASAAQRRLAATPARAEARRRRSSVVVEARRRSCGPAGPRPPVARCRSGGGARPRRSRRRGSRRSRRRRRGRRSRAAPAAPSGGRRPSLMQASTVGRRHAGRLHAAARRRTGRGRAAG